METKDWLTLAAPAASFVAALMGGGLGGWFTGKNERIKLLRDRRVTAAVDLVTSGGRALHLTEQSLMYLEVDKKERFEELSKLQNEANALAWSAYHRLRLLGPDEVVAPVEDYWEKYRSLQDGFLTSADGKRVFKALSDAERSFHRAVGPHMRV